MIQTIRSYVRQLQANHHLTLVELSAVLGYRSPTSLVRLMQGKANSESVFKLAARLHECEQITLTEEENRQLNDILELEDLSETASFMAILQLRKLLKNETDPVTEPLRMTVCPGGAQMSFAKRYSNVQHMHMVVLNSIHAPIFDSIAELLKNENISVEHYVCMDDDPVYTAKAIRLTQGLLPFDNYSVYTTTLTCNREVSSGLLRADLIVCDYVDEDGRSRHDLVTIQNDFEASILESSRTAREFQSLLPDKSCFTPVRYQGAPSASEDYVAYCEFCLELEKGSAVYRIKQDVGMDELPVSILRRATEEGPAAQWTDTVELIDACETLFQQRHKQLLTNREPQHHVMKRQAMWQFVKTGRMSDHFWACRTFTLEERAAIINHLLELKRKCPDYHLYFLKYDDELRNDEFVLYGDKILSIIQSGTAYHLDGGHVETMVGNPEFLRVFRGFYLRSIVRHHTMSEADTEALLIEMRSWCLEEAAKAGR